LFTFKNLIGEEMTILLVVFIWRFVQRAGCLFIIGEASRGSKIGAAADEANEYGMETDYRTKTVGARRYMIITAVQLFEAGVDGDMSNGS
jgi:hypothetical protein